MGESVVLEVHRCHSLRIRDALAHDHLHPGVTDEHPTDVQVHEVGHRVDQGSQPLGELKSYGGLAQHIFAQNQALQVQFVLELGADLDQDVREQLAVDQLQVFNLHVVL